MHKPVLILGAGLRLTLTIARSLHRQDIPVVVAPIMSDEPPIRSRAIRRHVRLPNFKSSPDQFLKELTDLIFTEGIDMVMPTGDGAMVALAQHYESLARLLHVGSPAPDVMERVLNKELTLTAAEKCGIPIPASRVVEDPSQVNELVKGLCFPLIAKPVVAKGGSQYKVKYFVSLDDILNSIEKNKELWRGALLQEYVPGVGKGVGVLMQDGNPIAMFQHCRIKEFPFSGGVSVMAEAESVHPQLGTMTVSLLREIEWEGIAMVEYRYDPSCGRFALMEVNGRYWGSLFLPAHAGVDFPYYQWQLAHGQHPIVPKTYMVGLRVRWLAGDVCRLHDILDGSADNEIEKPSRWKETVRFLRDCGFSTKDAIWSMKDPMPAIQEIHETLTSLGKFDTKRLIRNILPATLLQQIRIYRTLGSNLGPIFARQQVCRLLGLKRTVVRQDLSRVNSVLFVCLGNIIRSPMAELFLRRMLEETEKSSLAIHSAGLWEGLNRVAPRSSPETVMEVATEFGLSLKDHRSQPVTRQLIDASDVIFVMDHRNESMLLSEFPAINPKMFFLESCNENVSLGKLEVADPYGGTKDDIRKSLSAINHRVCRLAKLLAPEHQHSIRQLPHKRESII